MSRTGRVRGGARRLAALLPSGTTTAARAPFVLLVVVLLGSGLIVLLLLNSALNQGSFELSRLQKETTDLTDEQQALQQDVDSYSAPDALERRARRLGMVPGGSPVFLDPDGAVHGRPQSATPAASPMGALGVPAPDPQPAAPAGPAEPAPTATPSAAGPGGG
ncbi:septum formation initiator family protein [Streptomyces sp. NPDC059740]|uniref:FtsB family cell division protein n=1 Tax=Streptomyces sp. NPDC059740 TaxID=3346926 RepID=UPI00364BDC4F